MEVQQRCPVTISVEDECSSMAFRCEHEAGHAGPHLTHYPGQWGGKSEPVVWEATPFTPVQFYRDKEVK